MKIGKVFRNTPCASASHFVCICVLSLYTLYMSGMLRHEGKGRDSLQLKNGKLENVLIKHYALNRMSDPKGEWSTKENN